MQTKRIGIIDWIRARIPVVPFPAADDGGGDDAGDGGGEPSEAEKLRVENLRLRKEAREAKAAADKTAREAKTKKALEDDKLQEELAKTAERLAKQEERAEKLESAARERVEKAIGKLPKEVQDELAIVKDALPLEKLEALVERRAASASAAKTDAGADDKDKDKAKKKAPPAIGANPTTHHQSRDHEIHSQTREVMRELYAEERAYDVSKKLGYSDNDEKFGWGRTSDERETKANFMQLLRNIAAVPVGAPNRQDLANRALKPQG